MEEFILREFLGNSLQSWFLSFTIIMFTIFASIGIKKFLNIFKQNPNTKLKLANILVNNLTQPIIFCLLLIGIWISLHTLNMSDGMFGVISKTYHFIIILNITWLINRIFNSLVEEYVEPFVAKTESDLDDHLLPVIKKTLSVVIWAIGIIIAMDSVGYDVGALIAGLGIGGIAIAMAAKDSISNIFGGFNIFTDKPFKIGDRIKIGGYDGSVVEIGIRSTRLKTLDGTLVTIPNSKVTDSMVENVTREPSRKVVLNLGLTYETSSQNIEIAMNILRDIAMHKDGVNDDYVVGFNAFNDSALNIIFIYFIETGGDILKIMTEINLEILSKFNAAKLDFAFPTQTINLVK